jgi:hypothetical protein
MTKKTGPQKYFPIPKHYPDDQFKFFTLMVKVCFLPR